MDDGRIGGANVALMVWLSPNDAIRAIEEAQTANVPLFGFDGAFLRGSTVQPSLEDSWDYTGRAWPHVENAYDHAIHFIGQRKDTALRFEVVFGERNSN